MRSARLSTFCVSCLFVVFAIALVSAQSNPVAHASRPEPSATPAIGALPAVHFAKAVPYNSGGIRAYAVAVGDLNGDGHADLVLANNYLNSDLTSGGVSVLLGVGDGTFQEPVSYSSGGNQATSIVLGDINGDGKLDLIVANQCQNSGCTTGGVGVMLGRGDGTFQTAFSYKSGGYQAFSVALGDVNGDGHPDLVVGHICQSSTNCSTGAVGVMLGNGGGAFGPPTVYSSGGWQGGGESIVSISVAVGDVNGDHKPDLAVTNWCSGDGCAAGTTTVSVLLANGDGTFQTPVSYDTGGLSATFSVAMADLNGDGRADLVVTNWCHFSSCTTGAIAVLMGNGDGTFQPAVAYDTGARTPWSVAVADINGDGHLDVLATNYCQKRSCNSGVVSVMVGNGDGTLQPAVRFGSGAYGARAVAVGDVNEDGKPDILAVSECLNISCSSSSDGAVSVLLNGTLPAATTTTVTSSANPSQVDQAVTFTATVTAALPVPDGGTVTFFNGTAAIGTGTLTNGVATLSTSFAKAKSYTIKGTYSGDVFLKGGSGKIKQVVTP